VAEFAIPGTGTYVLKLSEGFVCPRVYTLTDKLFAEMGIPIVLDLVIRPADIQRSKTTCFDATLVLNLPPQVEQTSLTSRQWRLREATGGEEFNVQQTEFTSRPG